MIHSGGEIGPTNVDGPARRAWMAGIFKGPRGLRSGWKSAIFLLGSVLLMAPLMPLALHFTPKLQPGVAGEPSTWLAIEVVQVAGSLIATALLGRFLDKRNFGYFGMPGRRAFRSEFWLGALIGSIVLTMQLAVMYLAGWFHFGSFLLHGSDVVKYGLLWAAVFLATSVFEESYCRGYVLRVLAGGIGFWPAAVLLSFFFALGHLSNKGENWWGILMLVVMGLVLAFSVWRTGSLWFAIGNHAAWNWGQTFFFGTPDSGVAPSHPLMSSAVSGSTLMSGGAVGPEGSIVALLSELLIALLVAVMYRGRGYPASNNARQLEQP